MGSNRQAAIFHCVVAGVLFFVGFFPVGKAVAQTQQQIEWCWNIDEAYSFESQISGCTAVIQSGRWSGLDLVWALHGRGYAYYKTDSYDRALADDSEAIRLNPMDAYALNARCWVRTIVGRELHLALDDCNESLRIHANNAHTLDSRAFTCLKLGQINHAIADYDAALSLNRNLPDSYYGRGVAKLKKGDREGGNTDITAAKVIEPAIVQRFAKYGIRVDNDIVSIAPTIATKSADCARAVAQMKGVGDNQTMAVQ
jgi:tetratricopeptide (TPR) repeat protein